MLPVGTHTQGLERLPCNLDHSLSQFLLVYQWNVCGSTRICQMRICCASLEHHFIFEDSVEYDESLPWLEARRDLFSKLFLLVLIALSKIFPPYLLSLCLSNTSMKEFYFFRAVAVFQKHINTVCSVSSALSFSVQHAFFGVLNPRPECVHKLWA